MKATNAWLAAGVLLLGASSAFAVSSGYYSLARQHCTGDADDYANNTVAQPGCYNAIISVLDGNGHEYFGAGSHQTVHASIHQFDIWVDPGMGITYTFHADTTTHMVTGPDMTLSTEPDADVSKGLELYFGLDDNVQGNGEHDGSKYIANGPSDGGGGSVTLNTAAAQNWVHALQHLDVATLLSNPLPIGETGLGGCADGTCFPGLALVRAVIYRGGKTDGTHRDAPNYAGKQWPPRGCSGASCSEESACRYNQTPAFPDTCVCNPPSSGVGNFYDTANNNAPCDSPILYWHGFEGAVYLEPGISIYEDPDPQASPLADSSTGTNPQTPVPALYVGTCGFIFGGGSERFDGDPSTNSAGQIALLNPLCN